MKKRKLILYISCSLDGYIAKPGEDLTFLNKVEKEGEDYGYNKFLSTVDTVIIGRKTFDWVMNQVNQFPHADKETYVITRTGKPEQGNIKFYSGDLMKLVIALKQKKGKNIFCDGGGELVNQLLYKRLFDILIISIIPVLVGNGIRLFQDGRPEQDVELISVKKFETGLVQLHYKMITEPDNEE